jgi:hypothetical protein
MLHGIEQVLDLAMFDEAMYLRRGVNLLQVGLPTAEWGPLYPLWYHLLSRLQPEPVALYYLSYKLLSFLAVLGTYALARRGSARPWLAFLAAATCLLSMVPHVTPRPALLALGVLLAVLLVATFLTSLEGFLALVGSGFVLVAYARPEYTVSALAFLGLLLLVLVWRAFQAGRVHVPALGWAVLPGLVALVLLLSLGNPLQDTTGRRFYAFCQHFSFNYAARTPISWHPWNDCERSIQAAFGEVSSVTEAARSNPRELLAHLGRNLWLYPTTSVRMFVTGLGGFESLKDRVWWLGLGRWLFLALAGWQLVWLGRRRESLRQVLSDSSARRMGLVLGAVVLPVILSSVLYFPRAHYLVIQSVVGVAFLALLTSRVREQGEETPLRPVACVGLALGLVLLTPDLGAGHLVPARAPASQASTPGGTPHLSTVRFLRSVGGERVLKPGETLQVLDAQGGYSAYLGAPFQWVPQMRKDRPFLQYVHEKHVDFIVLDEALRKDLRFAGDEEFVSFLAEPEAYGFSVRPIPGTRSTLAIRDVQGALERDVARSRP